MYFLQSQNLDYRVSRGAGEGARVIFINTNHTVIWLYKDTNCPGNSIFLTRSENKKTPVSTEIRFPHLLSTPVAGSMVICNVCSSCKSHVALFALSIG